MLAVVEGGERNDTLAVGEVLSCEGGVDDIVLRAVEVAIRRERYRAP